MHSIQLLVLLWKNWILYRRYYAVTFIEVMSPIIFSLILLFAVSETRPANKQISTYTEVRFNATKYNLFDPVAKLSKKLTLLYAPNTIIAKKLIDTAFEGTGVITQELSSEEDIIKAYENHKEELWGAVIFSYCNGSTLPPELKYKIRLNPSLTHSTDPLQQSYYPEGFEYRLKDYSPYKENGFLAMQILIDCAYITLRLHAKNLIMPQVKITIKRFPLPSFVAVSRGNYLALIIPFFMAMGYLVFFLVVVKRVVEEKNNRAKEMMKMMGMNTLTYWGSVFISNIILAALIGIIVTMMYASPVIEGGSILRVSTSLFYVVGLMYCASSLLLCFVITTVFSRPATAITFTIVFWIVTTSLAQAATTLFVGYSKKMAACLVPNIAIHYIVTIIYHGTPGGHQWSNIMQPMRGNEENFSIGSILLMMLLSCVVYSVLLWYLDAVWPWQPGVPKPLFFFLQQTYWCPSWTVEIDCSSNVSEKSKYFEEQPKNVRPSVVVYHLTKVFGKADKVKAVDDLFLNMYPGQIVVLLGHNGAGKTTTMNILTGIFPPTSGTAFINGHDIVKDTIAARSSLGLCPQHNVLYGGLTVEEHLQLFAGLRGKMWWKMRKEIQSLLKKLQLLEKRKAFSNSLSGGMQRKLSLANAIIGQSKVLILDEPTTGLDPESRRGVWNLLEELRPKCTILLTTHYMEEADALGDRIAIMTAGRIQCCGSSMFLKREFGAGYQLRIEKGSDCNVKSITTLIKRHIPQAVLLHDAELELIYSLSNETSKFSKLFQELEGRFQQLGIESCGVDATTIDSVFLKVAEMAQEQHEKDENKKDFVDKGMLYKQSTINPIDGKITSLPLQQMEALFVKRFNYAKRHRMILIFQLLLPLISILLFIYIHNITSEKADKDTVQDLSFELRDKFERKKFGILHIASNTNKSLLLASYYNRTLMDQSVELVSTAGHGIEEFILGLNIKLDMVFGYVRRVVVGASVAEKDGNFSLTAWFNGVHFHLDPISVNLLTNTLLRFLTEDDNGKIHITVNLFKKDKKTKILQESFDSFEKSFSIVFFPMGLTFLSSSFVLFPTHERVTRAKLLQRMCGISGIIYWLMNFCWDFIVHISSSLILVIPFLVYDVSSGLISLDAIGAILLFLLLYGLSSIPFSYMISFMSSAPITGFSVLTISNTLAGVCSAAIMATFFSIMPENEELQQILWFLRFFPNFATTWGIKNIYTRSIINSQCSRYNKTLLYHHCQATFHHCCTASVIKGEGYIKMSFFAWKTFASGKECLALFLSFFLWFGFTLLLETNIVEKCAVYITNIKIIKDLLISETERRYKEYTDVAKERQRIEELIISGAISEEALVVYKLTKDFRRLRAVNNLTFGVHKEECFGLLGVNGAGKTTTFRMLTGDLIPSMGDAYIKHSTIQYNLKEFQTAIGYCPQFDALLDRLTTRETLQLFARLKRIPENEIDKNINTLISMCGLEDFENKLIYTYSGGTKRKLSLATALLGAPSVVLLDEPTSGVDPISRRKIWKTLTTMKDMLGVSLILTSHSMDECEMLCNRIAIMVNGAFRCIGSMQSLKSKFGQGYKITAKAKDRRSTEDLKAYIQEYIPSAELKEDFHGTLHYYVTDISLKWSRMFSVMEAAQEKFKLEDYLISGARLEQIFLMLAREQK